MTSAESQKHCLQLLSSPRSHISSQRFKKKPKNVLRSKIKQNKKNKMVKSTDKSLVLSGQKLLLSSDLSAQYHGSTDHPLSSYNSGAPLTFFLLLYPNEFIHLPKHADRITFKCICCLFGIFGKYTFVSDSVIYLSVLLHSQ